MNNARAILAFGLMALASGCANHDNTASTVSAPPTPATDKKLIKTDSQAAELALSSDHQAVLPTTLATATTRATDSIVSSLRIAVAHIRPSRQAATQPANQNIDGTVTFTQVGSLLIVVAELSGLQPNTAHALEIHESADLSSQDLNGAGDRWLTQPDNASIALLANVEADSTGKVYFERTLGGVTVGGDNSVVGHSVILYAQPAAEAAGANAGDSNSRIAGGVIERHDQ